MEALPKANKNHHSKTSMGFKKVILTKVISVVKQVKAKIRVQITNNITDQLLKTNMATNMSFTIKKEVNQLQIKMQVKNINMIKIENIGKKLTLQVATHIGCRLMNLWSNKISKKKSITNA